MIEAAGKYAGELESLRKEADTAFYRVFNPSPELSRVSFVSTHEGKPIGEMGFILDKATDTVTNVSVLHYGGNTDITFMRDVNRFVQWLMDSHRKTCFVFAADSPHAGSYRRTIARYGGRTVGTSKGCLLLADGWHDAVLMEADREGYREARGKNGR